MGGSGLFKASRDALLWENDELGRSAKRGFDLHLANEKKEAAESIPFEVRNTDFTPHVRRLANTTPAPAAARVRANCAPKPPEAPVTKATRPDKSIS